MVIKYLENNLKINEKKLDNVKSIRIFALYLKNKKKDFLKKSHIYKQRAKAHKIKNTMRTLTNIFDFAFFAAEEDYSFGRSNTVIS